jgi:FixJ family two-component response regulator
MSGHTEDAADRGGDLGMAGDFIPKPFSVDMLRRAMGRATERQSRGRAGMLSRAAEAIDRIASAQ